VQIQNSSLLVLQSTKFIPNSYNKINKIMLGFLLVLIICFFVSFQLFDEAFSTFHVKFIKIINVEKITNAFVIFC